jgi:hypothetical protein
VHEATARRQLHQLRRARHDAGDYYDVKHFVTTLSRVFPERPTGLLA